MSTRLILAGCLGVAAFGLAGGAAASPPVAVGPPATADALAVLILGPDGGVLGATSVATAPPDATSSTAFAYPDDGSVASIASSAVEAGTSAADGTSYATADLTGISLFGGEITASSIGASASSAGTVGDLADSGIISLTILGTSIPAVPGVTIPLADWGTARILSQSSQTGTPPNPSWRGSVTALVIHLDADHGALLAGSEIRLGYAEAYARPPQAKPDAQTTTQATPGKSPKTKATATRPHMPQPSAAAGAEAAKKNKGETSGPTVLAPPLVTPKLTAGGYVFPIYGPSGYGDTFGAPRGNVSGGWHHGADIFAPLGAPVLAVASGTVFSVGWNDIGGWRLWLRDKAGNEFYYAHLSAFSSLAVNGRRVKAGQVLGFVGNSGDAAGTPFHVHFEVHPVSMLFLGYDGAVNPTAYLDAWKRLDDVRILPAVAFTGPQATVSTSAPAPGAILLQSSDISTANGLDPGSLRRAMRGQLMVDLRGSGVAQLPTPLPVLDRA